MSFIKSISQDLLKILSKAADSKIYGSVEIYFEAGSITQITQRIINKVHQHKKISTQKITRSHQNIKEISAPHPTRPA